MELIKIGDLVSKRVSYHPPKMIYGNITQIKDDNDELHEQYEVITGHGDKNSKLKVTISYFTELDEDYHFDITDGIRYLDAPLIKVENNMHNLVFHTEKRIRETFIGYKLKIDKINNKINFLKKHRNIIERREEILSNIIN
jgi:hypothetical protein